ncbi:hypothetical protein SB748_26400 [Rhizobium sp. SIMBA_035]
MGKHGWTGAANLPSRLHQTSIERRAGELDRNSLGEVRRKGDQSMPTLVHGNPIGFYKTKE